MVAALPFLLLGCSTSRVSQGQLESLRRAAQNVLPSGADVQVQARGRLFSEPDIVINAHLLEGHSADEVSPYVRGDYGTHEKLMRLVRYRCVRMLRAIAADQDLPQVRSVVIQALHGVRVTRLGVGVGSTTDEATIIYTVRAPFSILLSLRASSLQDDDVMQQWGVETDIIGSLQFVTSPF